LGHLAQPTGLAISAWALGMPHLDLDLNLAGWAAVSQVALAVTAFFALLGAAMQVRATRSASREVLTYNYTQRFAKPDLLPYHQKTAELFRRDGTSAEKQYRHFQKWKYEEQLAALLIPNLFEELAGMYNQGLLHRRISKEFFGYTSLELWERGHWFIELSRRSNPKYYEQWELMLQDMSLLPRIPG
jgi:hypothetical protein